MTHTHGSRILKQKKRAAAAAAAVIVPVARVSALLLLFKSPVSLEIPLAPLPSAVILRAGDYVLTYARREGRRVEGDGGERDERGWTVDIMQA